MLSRFYKWLYTRLGGKPWTDIWRDIWHQYEWFMQTLWFGTGLIVGIFFSWKLALVIWAVYTYGYLNGHFFWGTPWKGRKQ